MYRFENLQRGRKSSNHRIPGTLTDRYQFENSADDAALLTLATKIDSIVPPRTDLLFFPKIEGSPRDRYKIAGWDGVTIYLDHFRRIDL